MVSAFSIDVGSLYNEFTGEELGIRQCFKCLSVIEHEISDLGFIIEIYTNDIRNNDSGNFPRALVTALETIVVNSLFGIPAEKRVYLSILRTTKHILITVI